MATITARAWAVVALCGLAATGCKSTALSKVTPGSLLPKGKETAVVQNTPADAKSPAWNRNDTKLPTVNSPALPPPTPGSSTNITTASTGGATINTPPGGMISNSGNGNIPPLKSDMQLTSHSSQSHQSTMPVPAPPVGMNANASSPSTTNYGIKLPDTVTRNSMAMPPALTSEPAGTGMPLPAGAPPVNDVPAPTPPMPTPSPMPAPVAPPMPQGMPVPVGGLPAPVQLPPIKARPTTN